MASQLRSAIVTGSSRGIGAAVAERLAHDGFAVVVNYSGADPGPADALVARITAGAGQARRSKGCSMRRSRPSAGWMCSSTTPA